MRTLTATAFEISAGAQRFGYIVLSLALGLLPLSAFLATPEPDGSLDPVLVRGLTSSAACLGLPILAALIGAGTLRSRLSPGILTSQLTRIGLLTSRVCASFVFLLLPAALLFLSSMLAQSQSSQPQLERIAKLERVSGEYSVGPESPRYKGVQAGLFEFDQTLNLTYDPQPSGAGVNFEMTFSAHSDPNYYAAKTMVLAPIDPNDPLVNGYWTSPKTEGNQLFSSLLADSGRVRLALPEGADLSEGFTITLQRARLDIAPVMQLYSERAQVGSRTGYLHTLAVIAAGLISAFMLIALGALCSARFTYGSSLILCLAWLTLCFVLPVLTEHSGLLSPGLPDALSAGGIEHSLRRESLVFRLFPQMSLFGVRERFEFGLAAPLGLAWRAITPALIWPLIFLLVGYGLLIGREYAESDLGDA